MTGKRWLLPLGLAVVLVVPAASAHATTWGGDVFGAFSTHSMADWNDQIDQANLNGANADNINSSFGGGLGLRLLPNQNFMLEATWEPLFPSTKDRTTGNQLKLTANSFQATGTYFFPSMGPGKFGIAAGVGLYSLNGKVENFPNPSDDVTGTGGGFHILGTGEWQVSPGFAFFGAAGYRYAKITDTEINGVGTSPRTETDFSGATIRAGLAFYASGSNSEREYNRPRYRRPRYGR